MYNGKKIIVVMPAYNAAQTVTKTVDEVLQQGIVDEIILVDDRSQHRKLWEEAGGLFIHHTSAATSIAALKAAGYI